MSLSLKLILYNLFLKCTPQDFAFPSSTTCSDFEHSFVNLITCKLKNK